MMGFLISLKSDFKNAESCMYIIKACSLDYEHLMLHNPYIYIMIPVNSILPAVEKKKQK